MSMACGICIDASHLLQPHVACAVQIASAHTATTDRLEAHAVHSVRKSWAYLSEVAFGAMYGKDGLVGMRFELTLRTHSLAHSLLRVQKLDDMSEAGFREMHGKDDMAVDKLDDGIEKFKEAQVQLEDMLAKIADEKNLGSPH